MNTRRGMSYAVITALVGGGVIVAAAAGHAAHAQDDVTLPTWIKTLFGFYAAGEIGDGEIVRALEYLINDGVINVGVAGAGGPAEREAAAAADMSAEAKSLVTQAEIAECMADELAFKSAAWALDVKSTREYTSDEYTASMTRLVSASVNSVQATDAWAAAVRQAAADGTISAADRTTIAAAEATMAAADAAIYDAFMATAAGQFMNIFTDPDGGGGYTELYLQELALTGSETECY